MKHLLVVLFFLLIVGEGHLFGQENFADFKYDKTKNYIIELVDDTRFVANVIEWDSLSVFIKTSSILRIAIPYNKIKKIIELDSNNFKAGEYWFENPHSTRYLFAPSAYNLKKGEGYYQNAWLILNSFNIGITDYFSFGGGIELISTFGEGKPIFFLTPKVGFKIRDKLNVGGGIIFASIPDFDNNRFNMGITYGIATYGSLDHNFTGGLGWGFFDREFESKPIIVFAGMARVGKKWALVTENWIAPIDGYRGIYSYGVRFFGEKIAIDLAFLNNADIVEAIVIGIPYIDFVIKF